MKIWNNSKARRRREEERGGKKGRVDRWKMEISIFYNFVKKFYQFSMFGW